MQDYEIDNDKPQVAVRTYGTSIFVMMLLFHCLNVVRTKKAVTAFMGTAFFDNFEFK